MANKIFAPKPSPGPIEQSLTGKAYSERAVIKTSAIRNVIKVAGYSFLLDGIAVTVLEVPTIASGGLGISFVFSATKDGQPLPMDNPYLFINPPIKTFDGTWRIEDAKEVRNYSEDVLASAKRIVVDAIVLRARQLGWTG